MKHKRMYPTRAEGLFCAGVLMVAALLACGCSRDNPVAPQLAQDDCRPCPAGELCPQECYPP